VQATPATQPAAPPPTQAPRPTPTPLPVLPTSVLTSLPGEQAQTARDARQAVAGGDYTRAITLLDPLAKQLSGESQAEARLLLGQAQVGDRQFDKALATGQQVLDATTRADLVSAARLLKGQALRGLERWDDAADEMRAVADANPLVAPAVRL